MFFLGKLTVVEFIVIDLLLFFIAIIAHNKWRGADRGFLSIQSVPFYFLQLFLVLFFAPLRPEGVVFHLSGYNSNTVKISPIVQDKLEEKKGKKLKIRQVDTEQRLDLNLLRFKDKPRHFVMEFGKNPTRFDVTEIELYTTFFSNRISVIKVPGNAVDQFLTDLSEKNNSAGQGEDSNGTLKKTKNPAVLLFRLHEGLTRYAVWHECLRRSFLWSIFFTIIYCGLVFIPISSRMALQHANNVKRNAWSSLSYYYLSTLTVCFSLAIFVLLTEYATRFYFRDILSTASGRNYFYNNSYGLFRAEENSHNFRGADFTFKKKNTFRIVVMGDSISYGQGVYPYTKRYSDLVEKRLNSSLLEPGIEVINLGLPGLDLPQHINLLSFVKALQPDFILYQWFINDMDFMGKIYETKAPNLLSNQYWHKKLMNNSSLYFFLQRGWNSLFIRLVKIKSYEQHIKDLFEADNSPSTQKSTERLRQLLDGIEDIGVPYGVVLFPHAAYTIQNYPFAFMHERIMKICEKRNIPCLDLRESYSPFDDDLKSLWANELDPHPSALAHDIAARIIIDSLGAGWQKQVIQQSPIEKLEQ